jgi:hypothetical protein
VEKAMYTAIEVVNAVNINLERYISKIAKESDVADK